MRDWLMYWWPYVVIGFCLFLLFGWPRIREHLEQRRIRRLFKQGKVEFAPGWDHELDADTAAQVRGMFERGEFDPGRIEKVRVDKVRPDDN